jgi:serine/threonine protein phosphatase PrpC
MATHPKGMPAAAPGSGFAQAPIPASSVQVDIGALTDIGRVRETNEDAYLVCRLGRFVERLSSNVPETLVPGVEQSGYVMTVADGMGGHAGGQVASSTALAATVRLIVDAPKWSLKLDDPATREDEIRQVWERAGEFLSAIHEAVRDRAAAEPSLAGMGTTLTTAFSVGADLFVFHVGDSRAYLFRDGRLQKITRDHTVAQHYIEMGIMRPDEAESGRLHHVLTQAVGVSQEGIQADMHGIGLQHGDRLLLCTDGLSNLVSESEMGRALDRRGSSEETARALVDLALQRGAPDNVTVIVASYTVAPPAA